LLAALAVGTTLQISACQEQVGLFALRTVFSSFTLPINQLLIQFFNAVAEALPQVTTTP
jgi:hypothetical protein